MLTEQTANMSIAESTPYLPNHAKMISAPIGSPPKSENRLLYLDFYQLKEAPFSITPDPEFLFFSETHRNAIEKMTYGINNRLGFMVLTGEIGTGKTTICRLLLDNLDPQAELVYIINPSLSGKELISGILDDLGIDYPSEPSKKTLIDRLNHYLLSRDNQLPVVVIIDDAQTMSAATLEDMRLLSNLETDKAKLLQIILVGQPELESQLSQPHLRQLKQRVTINCRLAFLKKHEVAGYIERRLFVAGSNGHIEFTPKAKHHIAKASNGNPRMINKICDYALIAAYVADANAIETKHVKKALVEMEGIGHKKFTIHSVIDRLKRYALLSAITGLALVLIWLTQTPARPPLLTFPQEAPSNRSTTQPMTAHKFAPNKKPGQPAGTTKQLQMASVKPSDRSSIEKDAKAGAITAGTSSTAKLWTPTQHPYVIQLGTFKTYTRAMQAMHQFYLHGLSVHWNPVNLGERGIWYRIYTGRFKTKAEALAFKDRHALNDALIAKNPWTVLLGVFDSHDAIKAISAKLRRHQLDHIAIYGPNDHIWLMSGAFVTKSGAQKMAGRLRVFETSAQVVRW